MSNKILKVFRYPSIEDTVYIWTGIKESNVLKHGDVVLIGYAGIVDELYLHGLDVCDVQSNKMFKWIFLRNKQNRRILYFGFDYIYWGSIIGRIARGFYEDGAKLVIHIANLGSCREPEDVGSSIFIPMIFMRIETRGSIEFVPIQWNPILQLNWDYNSGIHACVRSPLDETYEPFRKVVTRIGATSVETEAFHIEEAAKEVNQERKNINKVGFSGIYFATDYVRKPYEKISLTLTKKAKVRRIRKIMLPYCARIVAEYLNTLTDTPEAE